MKLWVAVWGDAALVPRAEAALRSMVDVHPRLDGGRLLTTDGGAAPAWAGVLTDGEPEGAVATAGGSLALVDGFAVHAGGSLLRAGDLLSRPPDAATLDGQFTLLRVTPGTVEVTTDALGMRAGFEWSDGRSTVLANSAELVARTVGDLELDAEAAGLYLAFGSAVGDATLLAGVRQIDGGRHRRRDAGGTHDRAWFHRRDLAGLRSRRYEPLVLAEHLESQLVALAEGSDGLAVPLSAGMDSRLIAALVHHAGITARYYTVGDPNSLDAQTAPVLAALLAAGHEQHSQSVDDVMDAWPDVVGPYVLRTDGMASTWLLGDTVGTEAIGRNGLVAVHGLAGELARWYFFPLRFGLRPTLPAARRLLSRRLDRATLLRPEVVALAQARLDRFVTEALDEGFDVVDLPVVWQAWERARRWGGANNRKLDAQMDVFTPFTTRAFLDATFRLKPWRAYAQSIHTDLVRLLAPALHAQPPEAGAWPLQVPWAGTAVDRLRRRRRKRTDVPGRATYVFAQHLWPGRLRHLFLERYLGDRSALTWELVDRDAVERLLTAEDDRPRHQAADALLLATTLLEYEQQRRRVGGPVASGPEHRAGGPGRAEPT